MFNSFYECPGFRNWYFNVKYWCVCVFFLYLKVILKCVQSFIILFAFEGSFIETLLSGWEDVEN